MATVPYNPIPEVSPSREGLPAPQPNTNINAFGGQVANAIKGAGATIDRAGDEIYARAKAMQEIQNESEVRDAEAEYIIASGELRAQYHSTEGKNAVEGLKSYIEDNRRLQRDYADKMSNPQSRRLFERSTRSAMSRSVFAGAGHAATQNKVWSEKADAAVLRSNETEVYNNPGTYDEAVGRARAIVRNRGDSEGWDASVTQNAEFDAISRITAQRIAGLARTDPVAAQRFYNENKGNLTPEADVRAQTAVENNLYRVEANRISAEVAGTVPEEGQRGMTRREALDEAERRAKEVSDDPKFIQFVRDRTSAVISQRDRVTTDDNRNNMYRLGTVLTGGVDGKIPTSLEEMFALDPSMQQAWDRAAPSDRQRVMNQLKTNARGDYAWQPNGENFRRYLYLKGLSDADPNAFLAVDIAAEKMPFATRQQLITLQQKLQKAPNANPETSRAYNVLKDMMYPAMQAAGVLPSNPEKYAEFRGALQDALVQWRTNNPNKQPGLKEIQEIGKTLFREVGGTPPPPSGARGAFESIFAPWSFGSQAVPVHRLEPPAPVMNAWRTLPRFKDTAPTAAEENDFRREWRRREYQRLFGGSVSSERP